MFRAAFALVLISLAVAADAQPSATKVRCDSLTPEGSFADCFSGHYHGTGFNPPMNEFISFRRVAPASLRTNALWKLWLADAKRFKNRPVCANTNAIAYVGSFTFYGGGSFIACSSARPNMLNGFYRVKHRFPFPNDDVGMVLTRGLFSGTAASNVLDLVFSDATHDHFAEPEVALGPNPSLH